MSVDVKHWPTKPIPRVNHPPQRSPNASPRGSLPTTTATTNNDLSRSGSDASSTNVVDALHQRRLEAALAERDEQWRRREKSQVEHLQGRSAQMLSFMQSEVEKLQNVNRELERRLYAQADPMRQELDRLRLDLSLERRTSAGLRKELDNAVRRNNSIGQTLERTAQLYKDQLGQHEDRIRQLTDELRTLTLQNTYLSTQLRNYKLRDAVIIAHQRRKRSPQMGRKFNSISLERVHHLQSEAGTSARSNSPPQEEDSDAGNSIERTASCRSFVVMAVSGNQPGRSLLPARMKRSVSPSARE